MISISTINFFFLFHLQNNFLLVHEMLDSPIIDKHNAKSIHKPRHIDWLKKYENVKLIFSSPFFSVTMK